MDIFGALAAWNLVNTPLAAAPVASELPTNISNNWDTAVHVAGMEEHDLDDIAERKE